MLLGLVFQAFGIIFQTFSNTVVKGERLLDYYEEKVDFAKKSYSIPLSASWLLLLYYIDINWNYVMVLHGVSIIIIAYVFSHLKEGTYLNPDTEYLLGLILLISGLFAQNEFFLFYYRDKIDFYTLVYYLAFPYIMYIAIMKKNYVVLGLLFVGAFLQMKHLFDENLILSISSILFVGGLKIQSNLPYSASNSLLIFKGIMIWMIGSIGSFTQSLDQKIEYKQILLICLLAGILLNFSNYLINRDGWIDSTGSWLSESMIFCIFIAGIISSFTFMQALSFVLLLGCIFLLRKQQ